MALAIGGGLLASAIASRGASQAATEAANIQAQAAREGTAELARQFDITQEQMAPFREAGVSALEQQQALLGLRGAEAQQQAYTGLQESPAQQFLRQRQQRALLRNQAAIGGLGGGNIRSALQQQAMGFAQQDVANQYNRLAGLSGSGQAATQNIGQLGAQTSGQIAQLLGQAGQAQASGILGAQQARGQFLGQLGSIGLGAGLGSMTPGIGASRGAMLGLISDETKKTDIRDMSPEECFDTVMKLDIKAWRYIDELNMGRDIHIGPMAQQSPDCIKIDNQEMLDLHSELMLIAGAIQHMNKARLH